MYLLSWIIDILTFILWFVTGILTISLFSKKLQNLYRRYKKIPIIPFFLYFIFNILIILFFLCDKNTIICAVLYSYNILILNILINSKLPPKINNKKREVDENLIFN
jgi:hypothetical protein